MNNPIPNQNIPAIISRLHQTYCRLTGQNIPLRFDRQRLWFDFTKAGFTLADLTAVIAYLQKQIRLGRRNVGALKLSNLLQPERFEEDLHISRVSLSPPKPKPNHPIGPPAVASQEQSERTRLYALEQLRRIKESLGHQTS